MVDGFWRTVILMVFAGLIGASELYSAESSSGALDLLLRSYKADLERRLERGEISKNEFETFLGEITRAIELERERSARTGQGDTPAAGTQILTEERKGTGESRELSRDKEKPRVKPVEFFPDRLVYRPYVADPRRPRFSIKWLFGDGGESQVDTAMGGYFPLLSLRRLSAPDEEFQLALAAGIWSRWDRNENLDLLGDDFRGGPSFSYTKGPWALRLQYSHESDHLGDEFVIRTGRERIDYRREADISLGLSYTFLDDYRVYVEGGHGFKLGPLNRPWRLQTGIEWEGKPWFPLKGQPYAAFDLHTWEESKWDPNVNAQLGVVYWNQRRNRSIRLSLDLYRGRDPLGEFLRERIKYWSLGVSFDF